MTEKALLQMSKEDYNESLTEKSFNCNSVIVEMVAAACLKPLLAEISIGVKK